MKTKVVNLKIDNFDVYIGRSGQMQDGYFGNPFKGKNKKSNIEMFRDYFYGRLESDEEFKNNVQKLKGKTLGCFCKPKDCHGDVIVEYLENKPLI